MWALVRGNIAGWGSAETIAETQLSYSSVLAPFLLAGVGISLAIPAAQNSVVGTVDDRDVGKAAGANSMMRALGGVFGIALAVAVFAGSGGYASPGRFIAGFGGAIWVAAGIAVAGAACALALPSRRLLAAGTLSIGIVEPEEA
ncbi:MAG TPA: hypothetical protein VN618_00225 [Solirubrobacteraceae bacterium]|nr:hypothetical protein [Solirubrobacteraceae bacterium]